VPVTYAQAALGAEIDVPTLEGSAKLKISAGSQPNDLLRMRGLGVPNERGRRGDQIVVIQISVPKRLNDRQKELLKELGEIEDKAGEQKSFFERMKNLFE
jgi:molecular chaperone DnaJ